MAKKKKENPIEESDFKPFHFKLTMYTAGGPFLDGYILSIIGIAMTQIEPQFGLSSFMSGLIGASALMGLFIGGFFGFLTDKIGRQLMYTLDFVLIIVASVLQFWVQTGWELFAIRLILGIAVGADYPIATSLLTEFSPGKYRPYMLGGLIIGYYIGSTASYIVAHNMLGLGSDAWRWILVSSAAPAVILIFLRGGTPESPQYLLKKGKRKKAEKVVKKIYGKDASVDAIDTSEGGKEEKTSIRKLFSSGYNKRLAYAVLYQIFQIAPLFAMLTFGPQMLKEFGLFQSGIFAGYGAALVSFFFLLGCVPALLLVEKMGRRPLMITAFSGLTIGILLLGLFPDGPVAFVFIGFFAYTIFSGGPNIMDWLAPNELFPTEIRGTATGFKTSTTRVGAFFGTFLFVPSLDYLGVGPTMLIGAVVTFAGLLVCIFLAPETKGQTLEESSSVD